MQENRLISWDSNEDGFSTLIYEDNQGRRWILTGCKIISITHDPNPGVTIVPCEVVLVDK